MIHFQPLGDRAVVITLGISIDKATHRRVQAVWRALVERPIPGIVDCVPAFASVTVHYDPARASPYARMEAALTAALSSSIETATPSARIIEVPVCYGGAMGPDLEDVARHHGLPPDEVVRLHSEGDYLVHMLGFAPGFPYLGGLTQRLAMPRRAVPRTLVPAGSVGIGGAQTGVYSIASPGGWHLIGRTPLRLFNAERDPPALLRAGDRVRFRPISPDAFGDLGHHGVYEEFGDREHPGVVEEFSDREHPDAFEKFR